MVVYIIYIVCLARFKYYIFMTYFQRSHFNLLFFGGWLWMILHYPLESGSFQSDSNQTRTTAYQLSCGVTSGHSKHHSCVNGTLIVIAICHQTSCNLIELRKKEKHTIPIKTNQHLEKNSRSGRKPSILSESIQKERTFPFSFLSLPLLTIPSLNYSPIWRMGEWHSVVWNVSHV